ncbi:MAG TPA: VWA-like domain-containing protein, partial [Burkholderiales bacterium]|nr:VWA-like domain-containing protein [Burkholderiales bacterium]
PPGTLILDCFEGMTAEEIYPMITEEGESMDEHLYDGDGEGSEGGSSGGKPSPLSAREKEALTDAWKQYLAQAMQQAKQAGKLGGLASRMAGELLKSSLPWRMLLARHLSQLAREDYSYHRPSRREGNVILPSLRSAEADLVIALDVSGSVSEEEMKAFLSEINGIKGQLRARIALLACDSSLSGPWVYEPWEEFSLPDSFDGGGGTDFRPVFEWASKREMPPGLLVYFTDALGEFPENEPAHPVLWLVKGKAGVPWGERIQLN